MFKGLKLKLATHRVEKKARKAGPRRGAKPSFWSRVWWWLGAPVRLIKRIWRWICRIDLVGLVNLTLLLAIIVLFSMLIIDVLKYRKSTVMLGTDNVQVVTTKLPETKVLPIVRDENNKPTTAPVRVAKTSKCRVAERQTARIKNKIYGDVVVDRAANNVTLTDATAIKGNLILQDMRKYTLPCDMYIEGDLVLRNVGKLQFCGDFTVTGNIYVNPESSFGPIPRTARLGGYVIM